MHVSLAVVGRATLNAISLCAKVGFAVFETVAPIVLPCVALALAIKGSVILGTALQTACDEAGVAMTLGALAQGLHQMVLNSSILALTAIIGVLGIALCFAATLFHMFMIGVQRIFTGQAFDHILHACAPEPATVEQRGMCAGSAAQRA